MFHLFHLSLHLKPLVFLGFGATGFVAAPAVIAPLPPPPVVYAAPCAPYTVCPVPVVVAPYFEAPVFRPDFRVIDRWAPGVHYHHEFTERHFRR